MKDVKINIKSAAFPDQFVSDKQKTTDEFGLQVGQAIQYEWFRKDSNGNFVWPGFGENMRILKWIVDRVNSEVRAKSNSFGLVPYFEDINWTGLDFNNKKFNSLIEIPQTEGLEEISEVKDHFDRFGNFLPNELEDQRIELEARLLKEI